jgi:hypothetical protein
MSESFTHARCGGVLSAEKHQRFALADPNKVPVRVSGTETMWRCQRCRSVGVLGPETNNPPRAVGGLLKVSP